MHGPMPFVDMHEPGRHDGRGRFSSPVTESEAIRLTYRSARQLLAEVRALGGNPRDDRYAGMPSGRQARPCWPSWRRSATAQGGSD